MKLIWDEIGKRLYKNGVDHVILFPLNTLEGVASYGNGVAWNGITNVTESPDGAEPNDVYADNLKYLTLVSAENWKGSIKGYQYPKEFNACQGQIEFDNGNAAYEGVVFGQQDRQKFGLAWRNYVGNDVEGNSYGYELHVAYGLSAAPTEMDHATENDSPEAQEMSWEISSIPVLPTVIPTVWNSGSTDIKPVSHLYVDSRTSPDMYEWLKEQLEGKDPDPIQETEGVASRLPSVDEIINQMNIIM